MWLFPSSEALRWGVLGFLFTSFPPFSPGLLASFLGGLRELEQLCSLGTEDSPSRMQLLLTLGHAHLMTELSASLETCTHRVLEEWEKQTLLGVGGQGSWGSVKESHRLLLPQDAFAIIYLQH